MLRTVPLFDYTGENTEKRKRINEYIKNELREKVDFVFYNISVPGIADSPEKAIYGGHPDEEGCGLWAEALYDKLIKKI